MGHQGASGWACPVYELLGGLFRDRIPLYWSHFATYRAVWPEVVGAGAARSPTRTGRPARATSSPQGFKVLKTNLIQEGARRRAADAADLPRRRDRPADDRRGRRTGSGRCATSSGPAIGIAVDVQFDYRMGGIVQLARALEPFNLYWLEVESFDPDALLAAREQTTTRLCHGESLIRREQFRPFFQKHVTDVVMIETLSNGLSETPPDRRDGRAVRHDGLAPQLDEPARAR